jgi:DNA repair protein RecN (Recombination protein N)
LIDNAEIEFGAGLNLLTGETGSGKSIIVDSLGALIGDRVSSDLIKSGADTAKIEGLFTSHASKEMAAILDEAGIERADDLIIRREISASGRNRILINNQLATAALLKRIGPFLVDIHGQGEHATLFDVATHLEMLDQFAALGGQRKVVAEAFHQWSVTRTELGMLRQNEAEKLQMLDILKFQIAEIERANLRPGEDQELEDEKKRLSNIEKLSGLSDEAFGLLYDNSESTLATLDKATKRIEELGEYDARFAEYKEGLISARAVIDDAAATARDFRSHLQFSPERLAAIEDRLAEISRLTRKYGGSIAGVLEHLHESKLRTEAIESAEFREEELQKLVQAHRAEYVRSATALSEKRVTAAKKFEREVELNLKTVALEKGRFQVDIKPHKDDDNSFTARGFDRIEYLFSANVGEEPKPLTKVASGGEASRLTLILKTTAKVKDAGKAVVFDEIDAGIGGRVAQAVGLRLKELARTQQVLCVTHQPQVASQADHHFVVTKSMTKEQTTIAVRELDRQARIEEVARMLAGEKITDAARENAREMIAAVGK